mgnify:CR=1 FL=1
MNSKIEQVILQNLVTDDAYMRKVIPFLKRDYFLENNDRLIFDRVKTFIDDIKSCLKTNKIFNFDIKIIYAPAWTTDWMSVETKEKLRKYGISPPSNKVVCPQCNSSNTVLVSEFGATACKSFHKCSECLEPFEHFKCI